MPVLRFVWELLLELLASPQRTLHPICHPGNTVEVIFLLHRILVERQGDVSIILLGNLTPRLQLKEM